MTNNIFAEFSPKNLDPKIKEWHNEVYNKMSDNQKMVVDHLYGATSFSNIAKDAYEIAADTNSRKDGERVMTCGSIASMSMKHVRILKDLLKLDTIKQTLEKLQEIHDYFTNDERFPYHLPEPVDSEGQVHYKTIRGVYDDMWRFQTQMLNYKKAKEEQDEAEERASGNSGTNRRY